MLIKIPLPLSLLASTANIPASGARVVGMVKILELPPVVILYRPLSSKTCDPFNQVTEE